jgi:tetratricopeptide (TPR) repeat protein
MGRMLARIAGTAMVSGLLWAAQPAIASEPKETPDVSEEKAIKGSAMAGGGVAITESSGDFLSRLFAKRHRNLEEGQKYITKLLEQSPENSAFLRDALRISMLMGNVSRAQSYAARLPKTTHSDAEIGNILAIQALDAGDVPRARAHMEQISASGLFGVIQPIMLAWLDLDAHHTPLTMDEVIEKSGFFEPFLDYQLALINDVSGHEDTALRFYKLATDSQEFSPFRSTQAFVNFYARQQQWELAHRVIAAYKEANPNAVLIPRVPSASDGPVTRLVGTMREGLAELYFSTASLIYTERPALEVFWYLRLALHLRPDFPPAQFMLASLYEKIDDHARAIATYDTIRDDSVFAVRSQIRKALNMEALGKLEPALDLLNDIAARQPNNVHVLTTRGDMLRTSERFAEAAKDYSRALERIEEVKPLHWPIIYARGICYERSNAWDKAEADFQHALRLSPDQPDVLNYLGYSWLVMNRNLTQARDMLRIAVEARPDDAAITDSMGWAYYLTGDFTRAVEYLERAVNLAPSDLAIIDHLGDAYWRSGRAIEAQYQWQRVIQYAEEDSQRELQERAKEKLQNGLPPFLSQQAKQ